MVSRNTFRVMKMLKRIKWSDLHPEPVEGMIKTFADDAPHWTLEAENLFGKIIRESGNELEGYAEPKKIKKAFDKVIRQIDNVNDYLKGFLTIDWGSLKRKK